MEGKSMKKRIMSWLGILAILTAMVTGCSPAKDTAVSENAGTTEQSAKFTEHEPEPFSGFHTVLLADTEYEFADRETYKNPDIKKEVKISVGGRTIEGVFRKQAYLSSNYFPVFEYYSTEYQTNFSLAPDGTLTFYFGGGSASSSFASEEECVQKAKEFMSEIIDISPYTVRVEKDDEKKIYSVHFDKYVGDICTADGATVTIGYDGNLRSYSSFMLGKVPTDLKVEVDMDEVKQLVRKKLEEVYKEKAKKYDEVEYKEPVAIKLTMLKNGKPGLTCYTTVNFINYYEESGMIIPETVLLVISDFS